MIPVLAEITRDMLDAAEKQLRLLKQAQTKPHVLDDATINRITKAIGEQQTQLPVYLEQCSHWQSEDLNTRQKEFAGQISDTVTELEQVYSLILELTQALSEKTIDKILGMSGEKLAVGVMNGQVELPN